MWHKVCQVTPAIPASAKDTSKHFRGSVDRFAVPGGKHTVGGLLPRVAYVVPEGGLEPPFREGDGLEVPFSTHCIVKLKLHDAVKAVRWLAISYFLLRGMLQDAAPYSSRRRKPKAWLIHRRRV